MLKVIQYLMLFTGIAFAVYGAFKFATKKNSNGKSIIDDIKNKAPEFMDKAKRFKDDIEMKYSKNDVFNR